MPDIAPPSPSVKHADGLSCDNPSELKIRLGQEAMARQRRRWEDWIIIAEALDVGRAEVMRDLHTNQPTGRRYEKAMGEWLVANGFKEIDKAARCRLLECLQRRDDIEKWRALLTDGERFRFNHPGAVLRRWKAATAVVDPERCAEALALHPAQERARPAHRRAPLPSAEDREIAGGGLMEADRHGRGYCQRDGQHAEAYEGRRHREGNPQEDQRTEGPR